MNLFKDKIWCSNCGKKYNYRLDHSIPTYLCQKRKNYGIKACDSQTIQSKTLMYLIENHLRINQREMGRVNLSRENINVLIDKIMIDINGGIEIFYRDGSSKSVWNNKYLIF